jgi:hypothetical protein
MVYLVINNKIKFNISNLNAKELLKVIEGLKGYDLRLLRFN